MFWISLVFHAHPGEYVLVKHIVTPLYSHYHIANILVNTNHQIL